MRFASDMMVLAAATTLLVAGSTKLVQPKPVATTLAEMCRTVRGRACGPESPLLGRLLGGIEVGLAIVIAVGRSTPAAIALLVFAFGLAFAGVVGIASHGKVSCACFGRSDRALGWPQIIQLPLWAAAAWSVGQDPLLFGDTTRSDMGLLMLACCSALSTAWLVARLWHEVYPVARHRRADLGGPVAVRASDQVGSAW